MLARTIGKLINIDPRQSWLVHHQYPANTCKNNFNNQHKINNVENINNWILFPYFLTFNFSIIWFPNRNGKKHQIAKKYSTNIWPKFIQ